MTLAADAECRGLLRAVCETPGDDGPRLILADWWEDHGLPERAEFVRVQIALAALGHTDDAASTEKRWALEGRELTLWNARQAESGWLVADPAAGPARALIGQETAKWIGSPDPAVVFRRGFADELRVPLAYFLAHAGEIFREHPVTRVRLTDREPLHLGNKFQWSHHQNYPSEPDHSFELPTDIWHRMPMLLHSGPWKRDDSRKAARDALSRACVAWARDEAGLPPLEAPA